MTRKREQPIGTGKDGENFDEVTLSEAMQAAEWALKEGGVVHEEILLFEARMGRAITRCLGCSPGGRCVFVRGRDRAGRGRRP